jgi:hypothetical protein
MGYRINGILYEEGALPKQSYADWGSKSQPRESSYSNLNGRAVRPPRGTDGDIQRALDPSCIDDRARELARAIAEACAEELGIATPAIRWFGPERGFRGSLARAAGPVHPKGSTAFFEGPGTRGFHSSSAPGEIWIHESVAADEGQLIRTVAHECYHASETRRLRADASHFKGVEAEQEAAEAFAEQIAKTWDDLHLPAVERVMCRCPAGADHH